MLSNDEMAAMSRDEILERLRALMLDRFEVEPQKVQLETKLVEDLDLDSIDAIDMAVELQGWTGVPLAEEALRAVKTVDDVVGTIAARLRATRSGTGGGATADLNPRAAVEEAGAPRAAAARGPLDANVIMLACADRYLGAATLLAIWDVGAVAALPPNGREETI